MSLNATIYVVNRYRPTQLSRVDRVDYLWVNVGFWQDKMHTTITFNVGETDAHLKRSVEYGAKVVECKSVKQAIKLILASGVVLNKDSITRRYRYNRTAIRTMMARLNLQEQVTEALA